MTKNKVKKPNIGLYLKNYKFWIFAYIFLYALGCIADIFLTIIFAETIAFLTAENPEFQKAFTYALFGIGLAVFQKLCWYLINRIYYKYSNKIMSELSLDLAKQAFKLNSKTYNDHDTGTFVQRIVEDPARIIDQLSGLVDTLMNVATALVMFIYVATLNIWASLCFFGLFIIGFVLEYFRLKVRRKNRFVVRRKNDKVHSLTTEIVRSEKDIKSLGLESQLAQVSKQKYEDYRTSRYKMDMTDTNFWSLRNFIVNIGTLLVLLLGIYLMDLGTMTIATYMIIYSNRGSLWDLIFGVGQISNTIVDIKVSHRRMFSLFDEDEFVTEKFGQKEFKNVKGHIKFDKVSYTFKEYEFPEINSLSELKKLQKKKCGGGFQAKRLSARTKSSTGFHLRLRLTQLSLL